MKRQIALILAAAILAVSMTACGDNGASDTPAGTEAAEATAASAPETEITTAESVVTTEAPVPETEATEATTTEAVTEAPATEATTAAATIATTVMTTAATTKATTPAPATTAKPEAPDDPSKAYFEKYGIKCNGKLIGGENYYVDFVCRDDKNYAANGGISITNFETFSSDKEHAALDGYEWQTVSGLAIFGDRNFIKYGCDLPFKFDDYYKPLSEICEESRGDSSTPNAYTINFNGKDYTECIADMQMNCGWTEYGVYVYMFKWSFRVPKGYDGVVIYFDKYGSKSALDAFNADKNAVFFRLKK